MISAKEAEYMELSGAVKDAGCNLVIVQGGVSSELGCCDRFSPKDSSVQEFECGECKHLMPNLTQQATGDNFNEPLSSDDTSTPSFTSYNKGGALKGSHAVMPFKVKPAKVKSATLARAINQSKRAHQTRHSWGS